MLEQWRFFARDEAYKLAAQLLAPAPRADNALDTFQLSISGRRLASLDRALPDSGRTASKKARLLTPDGELAVKARYLGDNHWHWLYDQKSWRIRVRGQNAWNSTYRCGLHFLCQIA